MTYTNEIDIDTACVRVSSNESIKLSQNSQHGTDLTLVICGTNLRNKK